MKCCVEFYFTMKTEGGEKGNWGWGGARINMSLEVKLPIVLKCQESRTWKKG